MRTLNYMLGAACLIMTIVVVVDYSDRLMNRTAFLSTAAATAESLAPTAPSEPPTLPPATRTTVFAPAVGQEVHLISTTGKVFVAVDDAAWDAMLKASRANDTEGILGMVLAGKLLVVPTNTKARVIEDAFTSAKVRILEGMHDGKSGWVSNEMVGP